MRGKKVITKGKNPITEKINGIVGIKSRIMQLQAEEREMTKPLYTDMGLINSMYSVFCTAIKEIKSDINPRAAIQRCKFTLLMMLLYNPAALAGGKLKKGLRDRIAEATNCQQTLISHDVRSALGYARYYRTFSADVNYLFVRIQQEVREY